MLRKSTDEKETTKKDKSSAAARGWKKTVGSRAWETLNRRNHHSLRKEMLKIIRKTKFEI